MVTLGSMHPVFQQGFHEAAGSYDDALNLTSLELTLNDVHGGGLVESALGSAAVDPAEERAAPVASPKPARRGSILVSAPPPTTAPEADTTNSSVLDGDQGEAPAPSAARRGSVYTQSSAHRLFRAAPPEPKKQQWNPLQQIGSDEVGGVGSSGGVAPIGGGDSRLRASSWHSSSDHHARSPRRSDDNDNSSSNAHNSGSTSSGTERFFPKRRGRDDREVCACVVV